MARGVPVFDREIPFATRRSRASILLSVFLHVVVAAAVIYVRPEMIVSTARVDANISTISEVRTVMFIGSAGPVRRLVVRRRPKLFTDLATRAPQRAESESTANPLAEIGPVLRASAVLNPGVHDIKVALPQTAPTPNVNSSEVPYGFEGDIVVDILIDKTGKVVRATVKNGFAHLEEKVVSTVLNWHFSPATYDGVPVASIQEVHFHYPDNAKPSPRPSV